ncbi:tetratricopeptide repeat protein, partial [Candidatus Poribacteria bacterium]|nr:tetratricopeptide repeat protein [Candidatus Poribacteria bacterium]
LAGRKCLDRYTEITLKQLSSHESRRLVEELLTIDNLPESVKGMILRKSEGNPFFIEEVIRSLIDRDLVYQEADRWVARAEISDIDVPDTIQSVVMSRVDRLQAEARYVLQCASVIGRLFKYRLLEHLTQQERNLDRHLSEFEARDLVYEERTVPELEYAFKHAFTQEATYQGILEQKRRTFHSQVAQGIERLYQERLEEYYEELAHHYSRSEDAEKAVEYLLKAGEKAKRSCVNEAAIAHFKKTLEVLEGQRVERKDWKLEALRGLGEVYLEMGKTVEAEGAFESAIALAKEMLLSPCQLVRLYYWMASVYFWQSRFDEEIRYGEMGLELLEDNRECLEAALMNARIAIGNANKGNVEKWREYIHNMAFIKKLEYSIELRTPYDIIIHLFTYSGRDLETAWEWSKEWEIRAAQHHDLSGLAFSRWRQGTILTAKGDHKGSLSSFQKSLEMNKRIGREGRIRWCYGHIGKILLHLGNIEEAEKHTRLSLTMDEQAGHLRDIANTHNCLGAIAMCQHLWEEVISHFQNALEGFRAIKNLFKIAEAHLNLGRAYLKKGDCHRARQSFEEIVGKAIETQQNGPLANALWGLEATHLASGTPKAFIDFCCTFRAEHADAIENLSLRQWYLEPVPPSDQFPHLTFTDDFDAGTIAPSWTWMDEFNDCAYRILESGGVEISAANGRDFDGLNTSAPRFMREVSGDFAVEVCLSPASADKPWMGGLLIHQDKDNFLHFEIGVHGENEVRLHGYVGGVQQIVGRGILRATHVSPLQDSEGIVGARHALPNVHLRLERIGDEFSAYCSADGENWFTCGTMTLPLNDPIQLGICAIGMIDRTIYCGAYLDGTATVFRGFKLWCKSGENIVEERRG